MGEVAPQTLPALQGEEKQAGGMNLLPVITTSLVGRFHIRRATAADVADCDRIARGREKLAKGSLGWVMRNSLQRAVDTRCLHVAVLDSVVRGFVLFSQPGRGANKGWNVIHTLAVELGYDGLGIGRNLLYSVPHPVRLKCPQFVNGDEANPANRFYAAAGMRLTGADTTRAGKRLNVWERRILPILVQGTNRQIPRVAKLSGWGYGVRTAEAARDYPLQCDLEFNPDWRAFDWTAYMHKVCAWRPAFALALDYFERAQLPTLLSQIADLKAAGVLRVLVCPKFDGATNDIPADCLIAVSVPSSYAGYVPPLHELRGRDVHLLGGSPPRWFGSKRSAGTGIISAIQGAGGRVVAVDGNAHTGAAAQGGVWRDGVWDFTITPLDLYGFIVTSGRNIAADLERAAAVKQLGLFAA